MENIIIIGIIVILVIFGIRSGMKHFKKEGGCCGESAPVKRQKQSEKVSRRQARKRRCFL